MAREAWRNPMQTQVFRTSTAACSSDATSYVYMHSSSASSGGRKSYLELGQPFVHEGLQRRSQPRSQLVALRAQRRDIELRCRQLARVTHPPALQLLRRHLGMELQPERALAQREGLMTTGRRAGEQLRPVV